MVRSTLAQIIAALSQSPTAISVSGITITGNTGAVGLSLPTNSAISLNGGGAGSGITANGTALVDDGSDFHVYYGSQSRLRINHNTGIVSVLLGINPVANGTLNLGGVGLMWGDVYALGIRDTDNDIRMSFLNGASTNIVGNVTTTGSAIGLRFYNTNALTTVGDKIAAFYVGNGAVTEKASVAIDGSFVSALGTGTGTSSATGVISVNTTQVGSGADTTEDNLMTYALPAASLVTNGRGFRVTAWGTGANTSDTQTIRCYFGATVVVSKVLSISGASTWRAVFEVIRTGATTQIASGLIANAVGTGAPGLSQTNASPAETLANAITIKCTGQRAVSSVADSLVQLGMIVESI